MRIALITLMALSAPALAGDFNDYGPPEYGHGLTEKEALDGWISLFDGKTTFGWSGAKVEDGILVGGKSTPNFPSPFEVKMDIARVGTLTLGGALMKQKEPGLFSTRFTATTNGKVLAAPFELRDGLAVRTFMVRFLGSQPLFNGKDLTGWKHINHPKIAKDRWPKWTVKDGAIHAVGGPGALEHEKQFGDGVFQIEAKMNARHVNGGFFIRAIPGDFMNGYEAQLYNCCKDKDPGVPAVWATGAIDDRQNTRRLMSRDGQYFVMTVIANGPHLATWVNGHQTVDWTDPRAPDANPRKGKRVEPGVIQLQAHDVGTDITFRKVTATGW